MLEFFGQRCNQSRTRYYGIVQVEDRTEIVYGRLTDSNPHRHIKEHRSVTCAEKYFERKMFEKLMDGYEETPPPFHPYSITLTTKKSTPPAPSPPTRSPPLDSPPLDSPPLDSPPLDSPPQRPSIPVPFPVSSTPPTLSLPLLIFSQSPSTSSPLSTPTPTSSPSLVIMASKIQRGWRRYLSHKQVQHSLLSPQSSLIINIDESRMDIFHSGIEHDPSVSPLPIFNPNHTTADIISNYAEIFI